MLMLPSDDNLKYVVGDPAFFFVRPLRPFDIVVRAFLARLSKQLIADAATRSMPDVMSFAWWCRKSNIEKQALIYDDKTFRIGRGLVFHVTPSNVPVNFAFSWVFSLLAGNANVVRLPNRSFPQIEFLVQHIKRLLDEEPFGQISKMNAFVIYGHEDRINAAFSVIADARVLWGGDATIHSIRKFPQPARSVDICFANRYSFCILGAEQIIALEQGNLDRLVSRFFNDAYIMDQNACSSPRMVVWYGDKSQAEQAGDRFWATLRSIVEGRYELTPISSVNKLMQACRDAIELDCLSEMRRGDNRIYRIRLDSLPADIVQRHCGSGYFYEYTTHNLDQIAPIITSTFQTLTYYGVSREELTSFVSKNQISGIDRIVPVGEAMDIGLVWDGYDLIRTLSRVCDIH
jgi:hypothetical protein